MRVVGMSVAGGPDYLGCPKGHTPSNGRSTFREGSDSHLTPLVLEKGLPRGRFRLFPAARHTPRAAVLLTQFTDESP